MKLIFLDIDGVLATQKTYRAWRSHPDYDPDHQTHLAELLLCERRIKMLADYLASRPDVRVVISSSWRNLFAWDDLKAMLQKRGFPVHLIVGRTPRSMHGYRGREIQEWLEDMSLGEGPSDIVILDDDADMKPYMSRWIRTSFMTGLEEKHIRRMDRLFYGKETHDSQSDQDALETTPI